VCLRWVLKTEDKTGRRSHVLPPVNRFVQVRRKGLNRVNTQFIARVTAAGHFVDKFVILRTEEQNELLGAIGPKRIQTGRKLRGRYKRSRLGLQS